jgi:hypothetical protein
VSTSTVPPTNQTTSFETQMIPMTPQVLRRTLSDPGPGRRIAICEAGPLFLQLSFGQHGGFRPLQPLLQFGAFWGSS